MSAMPNELNELSDQQLSLIIEQLANQTELACIEAYKACCVKRRIAARIRRSGCQCFEQYLDRLVHDPAEGQLLAGSLSIHVSQFFRNSSMFETLQILLLPELLKAGEGRRLRFWSIGCSAGQEPYSLAMLLVEVYGRQAVPEQFEIEATDIDSRVLALAEAGCYAETGLRGISPERRERFFCEVDQGFLLRPEVRCLVHFGRMDLHRIEQYQPSDLVLCRNTLIYFNRPAQEKILHGIADILPPGGILVLGKSESMPTPLRSRFATFDPVERIYRRT